jgi:hypothetical protein
MISRKRAAEVYSIQGSLWIMIKDEKVITIRGIVIPLEWDERDNVIAYGITTHKEKEYLIDNDHKGRELIDHMQCDVEVTGVVRKYNNIQKITVTAYDVIGE